jgi:hypothetical protein
MKNARILFAVLVTGGLAACGDDGGTTPAVDATTDTTPDGSGSDVVDDTTPDVVDDTVEPDAGDTTPEVTPDVVEDTTPTEICDNETDDDGDGDVDCADDDCSSLLVCNPVGECDPACEDGFACVGGGCVEDGLTPETYEPAEIWSYIAALQVPENGGAAECCYDFTGDGEIDNGLAQLLGLLGGLVGDIDALLEEAFVDGTLTLLAEYRGADIDAWKATPRLSFWLGTNDLDGDGDPDDDYDARLDGEGTFRVEEEVFTDTGAPIQFNSCTYDAGDLVTDPAIFILTLPLDDLLPGLGNLDLQIDSARLEAALDDTDPVTSENETIDDVEYGGAKLGGILRLAQVFDALDRAARTCTCAEGIDGSSAVIVHGENADRGRYTAACAQTSYNVDACDPDANNFCAELLNQICGYASVIAAIPLADLDTDGSGIPDAITVGARLTMVNANIDDQWIEGLEGSGEGSGS